MLAQAQSGDERAYRALVEPYRRALHVHAYRMLGSNDDAEDVTQETLLRAWRSLERYEARASLQTWLFRIATNACLDEIERRPRRPDPIDPFPDALLGEADALIYEPSARYAMREGMELALLAAIQLLPGRQRAVLILRDVLGWTGPEVAELLDSTLAAVNSALQRARLTVDEALPPRAGAPADPAERELVDRYVSAWADGDVEAFVGLLREDAELRMPPQAHVRGAARVAEFLTMKAARGDLTAIHFEVTRANGRPALVIHRVNPDGTLEPHGVKLLQVEGGLIAGCDAFIGPHYVEMFAETQRY